VGLLGLLAFASYHDIHDGVVSCGFDNDLGLDKATEGHLNVSMHTKHANLIHKIRWIVSILQANFSKKIEFSALKAIKMISYPFTSSPVRPS
jgi:hypothetical protein